MRHMRAVLLIVASGCGSSAARTTTPAPTPSAAPNATSQAPVTSAPAPVKDSVTLERDRYVAEIRQQIAGKETLPSSQVFKNIKMMGEVPAGRLLAVMNVGYGKSLGVSCTHCHVAGEWDK